MANNTATGCGTLLVVALLVGGCMSLFNGDDEPVAAQPAQPVAVPDWANKPLVEAENEAKALGLDLSSSGLTGSFCSDETDCFIYKTVPKAGTAVTAGAKVAVKWWDKEERTFHRKYRKMPNVVGWSEEKANKLLEPIYWSVEERRKETTRIPVGAHRVLAQSPRAGRPLRVGQKVKLVIGFNFGSTSGDGGGGGSFSSGDGNDGEGRFCGRRWWC
ncbi:PASTA domain-containing protein [Streptosporangium sp. NPDC050855]|uniref:PASTA domain-containing protein n=1 Tax=Streptosporangium sp. NPDC050855 TaxID=3366194 RepID=UPI0037895085